jgi:hypothetical protein
MHDGGPAHPRETTLRLSVEDQAGSHEDEQEAQAATNR